MHVCIYAFIYTLLKSYCGSCLVKITICTQEYFMQYSAKDRKKHSVNCDWNPGSTTSENQADYHTALHFLLKWLVSNLYKWRLFCMYMYSNSKWIENKVCRIWWEFCLFCFRIALLVRAIKNSPIVIMPWYVEDTGVLHKSLT